MGITKLDGSALNPVISHEDAVITNTQKEIVDSEQIKKESSSELLDISQAIYLIDNEEEGIIRFICTIGQEQIGSISVTCVSDHMYRVGGVFVDPRMRNRSISSNLIKNVNQFLEKNHSLGMLSNTIKGNSASVYENNGWKRGEFKSHGAYGAYEYIFDCRK